MMLQVLPPGVQERDKADFGTRVFRISGDRAKGFGAGAKQDVVKRFLILVGKRGDLCGDAEDHMKIFNRYHSVLYSATINRSGYLNGMV